MPGRRFWAYVRNLDKLNARASVEGINHMAAAFGTLNDESRTALFEELDQRLGLAKPKRQKATLAQLRALGWNVKG